MNVSNSLQQLISTHLHENAFFTQGTMGFFHIDGEYRYIPDLNGGDSFGAVTSWMITAAKAAAVYTAFSFLLSCFVAGCSTSHSSIVSSIFLGGVVIYSIGIKILRQQENYSQGIILKQLSLIANRRGLTLATNGLCRGLAILNMYYHFLQKENLFFDGIKKIIQFDFKKRDFSNKKYKNMLDDEKEIEHFFNDIMFLHSGFDGKSQEQPEQLFLKLTERQEVREFHSKFYFASYFPFDHSAKCYLTFKNSIENLLKMEPEKKKSLLISLEDHAIHVYSDGKKVYFYDSNNPFRSNCFNLKDQLNFLYTMINDITIMSCVEKEKTFIASIDLFMQDHFDYQEVFSEIIDPTIIFEVRDDERKESFSALLAHVASIGRPQFLQKCFSSEVSKKHEKINDQHLFNSFVNSIKFNNVDTVKEFLKHPLLNPNQYIEDCITPFIYSIDMNFYSIVEVLLNNDKIDPSICDAKGNSPLIHGLLANNYSIMELLLASEKIDVNHKNKRNKTAISIAIEMGYLNSVQLLLKYNADPMICDENGNFVLHGAAVSDHHSIVEKLLSSGKVDPNRKNKNGRTPIALAAFKGCLKNVDLFLKYDCNPMICNEEGDSALHVAVLAGYPSIVERLLLSGKVNVNCKNHNGLTPLDLAVYNDDVESVKLLLQYNADPMICDHDGNNSLINACILKRETIAKLLFQMGTFDLDDLTEEEEEFLMAL